MIIAITPIYRNGILIDFIMPFPIYLNYFLKIYLSCTSLFITVIFIL